MRNSNTLAVLIFVRDHTGNPQNLTIYARITVNQRRAEISLKRNVAVNEWDPKRGKMIGTHHKARLMNSYLDEVHRLIMEAHRQLLSEGKTITAQAIKARYLGTDEDFKTLKDILEYHNKTQASVLAPGTLKNYSGTGKYLFRFVEEKYGIPDIPLKRLNYQFITEFEHYILNTAHLQRYKPCTQNGAMKHMERLMKMVRLAVRLEWLDKDPFVNYKRRYKKVERAFLTQRELRRIEETIFNHVGVERVKDVFLFSCYTGLSYIDVFGLTRDQLVLGIDGNYWINTQREKTSQAVKVPLLPQAMAIIEKYLADPYTNERGRLLPVYSNPKTNRHLREIRQACGIHKHITFHTARHTFATTITLSNGVPIESVSKMLGHTKLSTTQIYARVLERKVGQDMEMLRQKMVVVQPSTNRHLQNEG